MLLIRNNSVKRDTTEQRIIAIAIRLLEKKLKTRPFSFTSAESTKNYLRLQLERLEHEAFMVLFLDNQHRLIACETVSIGTINQTPVYPREIVKTALSHNAAAVVVAHNHPSGVAEPSVADRHITKHLQDALSLVEVRTLDHIVLGHGESVSFAERGWL
ncbi:JAB domain-containing protein [Serratia fonticola]|jgi:DNA repair protein RadC|uniref:JAB domain-containing protein n=1 Tax=Serratia fonticola TaxID=47917 RepID=UPI0021D45657|nr:DNA repair protein RadC [Serratia fonticola]